MFSIKYKLLNCRQFAHFAHLAYTAPTANRPRETAEREQYPLYRKQPSAYQPAQSGRMSPHGSNARNRSAELRDNAPYQDISHPANDSILRTHGSTSRLSLLIHKYLGEAHPPSPHASIPHQSAEEAVAPEGTACPISAAAPARLGPHVQRVHQGVAPTSHVTGAERPTLSPSPFSSARPESSSPPSA